MSNEAEVANGYHKWLNRVIAEGGWACGNCKQWRILKDREIEECPNCHDDAFDVYDFVAEWDVMTIP